MPPLPGRKPGRGRGRGRGKGRAGGSDAFRPLPLPLEAPLPMPILLEEVWVQCDACQKWRRLPPGTIVEEDGAWFCNQNPDKAQASCSVPEEVSYTARECRDGAS
ncbi:CW-type zinc finger-domain-containing protein [Haematococcus lacustris]